MEFGTVRVANQRFCILLRRLRDRHELLSRKLARRHILCQLGSSSVGRSDTDQRGHLLRTWEKTFHSSRDVCGREEERWIARVRIEPTLTEQTAWRKTVGLVVGMKLKQTVFSRILLPPGPDQPIISGCLLINTRTSQPASPKPSLLRTLKLVLSAKVCSRNGSGGAHTSGMVPSTSLSDCEAPRPR